jgi:nucleotide-binding universal stress UspA family protein
MNQYDGPVVVLLDGDDSLEWAAVEASFRGAELRIVHAFRWPYLFDPFGELTLDERDLEAADRAVEAASNHVRQVFPSLRISATIFPGRPAAALLNEARNSTDALVVIGHRRPFERSLARRLARRTTASLTSAV